MIENIHNKNSSTPVSKNLMATELDIFFTALMFFTRLPVPKNIDHGQNMLQKSARYFPWVGLVVGGISAATFYAFQFVFSINISLLFSMAAGILITGAFHEDGFADMCDAFGGGWTKDKILLIMKDSRLGTYGVIGVILILSFKFLLLGELFSASSNMIQFFSLIIAAHSSSRFAAVTIMQQYNYVTETDGSKSKPLANRKLFLHEIIIAVVGTLLPFIFLPYTILLTLIPIAVARIYLGYYFNKWIGGYTGDCLGATQQVCEVVFYASTILI